MLSHIPVCSHPCLGAAGLRERRSGWVQCGSAPIGAACPVVLPVVLGCCMCWRPYSWQRGRGDKQRLISAPTPGFDGGEELLLLPDSRDPHLLGATQTNGKESTCLVLLCCSKNICSSPQGLLTSDPDLELLLNKISTVNHLLSSLEKKVPGCAPVTLDWGHLAGRSRGTWPLLMVPRAGEPRSAPANPSPQ